MRFRGALVLAAGLGAAGAPAAGQVPPPVLRPPPMETLAISDVTVVDVATGRLRANRTVVVRDGRIVSTEGPAPLGARMVEGSGRYLIPGLWDAHVHIRSTVAPDMLLPQFVANGVTGVRDMASDCSGGSGPVCVGTLEEWRDQIEAGEMLGPRLVAFSSAPLNPPWDAPPTESEVREFVRTSHARGVDWVKVYYRLPPEALGWVLDEADRLGLRVGGHLPLSMTATEAARRGLGTLEHARDFLFDCFPGSGEFRRTARSQNPPLEVMKSMVDDHDVAACADVFRAFLENGTGYVPTHVTRRMDAYADDPAFRDDPRARYIPAQAWEAWQADADNMASLAPSPEGRRIMRGFYERGLEVTGRAHDAGVNVILGTDAGDTYVFPGSGVHDELGELVKAGLTPAEALASATIRSATFLGRPGFGAVEAGSVADLVLLDANPLEDIANTRRIRAVILGGRFYDLARLDAILGHVERTVAEMGRDPS